MLRVALSAMRLVPGLAAWRANTGILRNPRGQPVKFGINGQADITGIVAPEGWRFELEVKAPGECLTQSQEVWRDFIIQSGGLWFFCDYIDPMRLAQEIQTEINQRRTNRQ